VHPVLRLKGRDAGVLGRGHEEEEKRKSAVAQGERFSTRGDGTGARNEGKGGERGTDEGARKALSKAAMRVAFYVGLRRLLAGVDDDRVPVVPRGIAERWRELWKWRRG